MHAHTVVTCITLARIYTCTTYIYIYTYVYTVHVYTSGIARKVSGNYPENYLKYTEFTYMYMYMYKASQYAIWLI